MIQLSRERRIQSDKKLCACGCNELIPKINSMKKEAIFKLGHNRRGLPAHPNSIRWGKENVFWKGGGRSWHTPYGYVMKSAPRHPRANNVFEHILVMEQHVGRYLLPSEVVHHINGKRDDNRIENLELMTWSDHAIHHGHVRHRRRNELSQQHILFWNRAMKWLFSISQDNSRPWGKYLQGRKYSIRSLL